MAIPAGKTWKQHLNDQITLLVRFRDNVEGYEEFLGVPFEQMTNAQQLPVQNKATSGVAAVKSSLDDVVTYLGSQ